jgi:hypothetical protein
MRLIKWPVAVLLLLVVAGPIASVWAADPPCPPPHEWERMERAGWPNTISSHARCSVNHRYTGYYVGGGALRGHASTTRCPNEGTWGLDYKLFRRIPKVELGWHHNPCKTQGGVGAYKTDGPHILPEPE